MRARLYLWLLAFCLMFSVVACAPTAHAQGHPFRGNCEDMPLLRASANAHVPPRWKHCYGETGRGHNKPEPVHHWAVATWRNN